MMSCLLRAQVPVVDLRASDDELVREIRHACTTSGFFIGEH